MTLARALCGVCGGRWPWLFTAYWFDTRWDLPLKAVLDDGLGLTTKPREGLYFIPVCSRKCGAVNHGYVGGFLVAHSAYEDARRREFKAALPDWWPKDEALEEAPGRAA